MTVYIYGLWDPRTYELRYIGKSYNPRQRLKGHISEGEKLNGKNLYKDRWIHQLLKENLEPSLEILEECTEDNWQESEILWIKECRSKGLRLTNISQGGDGPMARMKHSSDAIEKIRKSSTGRLLTQVAKDKISRANKGKSPFRGMKQTDEAKRKISEHHKGRPGTNLGKKFTDEHKAKIGDGNRGKRYFGRMLSEEHAKNISKALIGKKHTPETIEKIRKAKSNISEETREKMKKASIGRKWTQAQREKMKSFKPMLGKHHSEETRKKISESNKGRKGPNKGRKFTDEQRENMRIAHLGYIIPEETKRKMSEVAKLRWAIKKAKNE